MITIFIAHPNTEAPTCPATMETAAAQSTIHGIIALITSLVFTDSEVAMFFFWTFKINN